VVNDLPGSAAADAAAPSPTIALGAGDEGRVGHVEHVAALAAGLEEQPTAALHELKAVEGMPGADVEGPERATAWPARGFHRHLRPIIWLPVRTDVTTEAGSQRETLAELFVVDVDVHIHEDTAQLAEYADSPWDVGLREIAKVEERYLDLPGISPRAEYRVPFPGGSNRRQIVETPAELRAGLDELHVNLAVLFPDHLLSLAMVRDPSFATTLARSYNSWLYERWLLEDPTLKGALVVPPQSPEAGAEDIRRHADHREFVCVYLPASGLRPLYGHRQYDVVYDAAVEAGLPVAIHSVEAVFPVFPFQLEVFQTSLAVHSVAHPFAMMANMISMLETGVPVRFPELTIAFMEAGTAWVPFMINRLDKEYVERRREVPFLQERPSHYIKRFFFGTQPIEEPERRTDVVALYELFDGEQQAMFASDWPHHDFDHPQHVFGLPFSPEARRKIMGENALRCFRLDA
jgi:predicted TIM-barrel fold metal-dependent hydrolase